MPPSIRNWAKKLGENIQHRQAHHKADKQGGKQPSVVKIGAPKVIGHERFLENLI